MGKSDFLTPKAIGNRIKARGLGKLRWYCQMCQKQCRDENGFKCHLTSESHRRQMSVVAANTGKVIDSFSETFEQGYLDVLSRRWGEKRVNANYVYNEYIKDRHHVHMNSTQWTTLTGFVKYLGQEGKCIVEETEKGWYVQYIDRDPETLARKKRLDELRESELTDEERTRRFLLRQAQQLQERAAVDGADACAEPTELHRDDESCEPVKLALAGVLHKRVLTGAAGPTGGGAGAGAGADEPAGRGPSVQIGGSSLAGMFGDDDEGMAGAAEGGEGGEASTASTRKRGRGEESEGHSVGRPAATRSALESIVAKEEARKRTREQEAVVKVPQPAAPAVVGDTGARSAHWIAPGIVVKIMNRDLESGKFYKEKAVVKRVHDRFVADVQLLDSSIKLRLDQDDLETVIPKEGGSVFFVNGRYRGEEGLLRTLHVDRFCADVELTTGPHRSELIRGVEYEDICRLA